MAETKKQEYVNVKIEYPYRCYTPGCTSPPALLEKVMFPVVFIENGEPVMKVACINCYKKLMNTISQLDETGEYPKHH